MWIKKTYYLLFILILIVFKFSFGQKQLNIISIGSGVTKNSIFDDYVNSQVYTGKKWQPFTLSYTRVNEINMHRISFYFNNVRLDPIYSISYFEYNYMNNNYGLLRYEFFRKLIDKHNVDILIGGGFSGYGSNRYHHIYNNLNPYAELIDSTINSHSFMTPSLDLLLGFSYYPVSKLGLHVYGGIPMAGLYSRPYIFNRKLSNGGFQWKLISLNTYVGLRYKFEINYNISSRFDVALNHNFMYSKYKDHYTFKNGISNAQIQLNYKFSKK